MTMGWDKAFCTEWVAALRSGKYLQGWGFLTKIMPDRTELNCCLGVACIVKGLKRIEPTTKVAEQEEASEPVSVWYSHPKGDLNEVFNSEMCSEVFGEDGETGYNHNGKLSFTYYDGGTATLTDLNDEGFTFDQIADVIEYEAGI
jgi:hypothetical protein